MRCPWAEVLAPLPSVMTGVLAHDTAADLSEDESDTELDFDAPTEARLREVFVLPRAAGRRRPRWAC